MRRTPCVELAPRQLTPSARAPDTTHDLPFLLQVPNSGWPGYGVGSGWAKGKITKVHRHRGRTYFKVTLEKGEGGGKPIDLTWEQLMGEEVWPEPRRRASAWSWCLQRARRPLKHEPYGHVLSQVPCGCDG